MRPRHRIRLAGPWEANIVNSQSHPQFNGQSLKMRCVEREAGSGDATPFSGSVRAFAGSVKATRKFNRPSGINADSRVWICINGTNPPTEIWLNDHRIDSNSDGAAATSPVEFMVGERLASFNHLAVLIELSQDENCLTADETLQACIDVCLEIEE